MPIIQPPNPLREAALNAFAQNKMSELAPRTSRLYGIVMELAHGDTTDALLLINAIEQRMLMVRSFEEHLSRAEGNDAEATLRLQMGECFKCGKPLADHGTYGDTFICPEAP